MNSQNRPINEKSPNKLKIAQNVAQDIPCQNEFTKSPNKLKIAQNVAQVIP
jgi:hypothetical protein